MGRKKNWIGNIQVVRSLHPHKNYLDLIIRICTWDTRYKWIWKFVKILLHLHLRAYIDIATKPIAKCLKEKHTNNAIRNFHQYLRTDLDTNVSLKEPQQ